MFRVLPASVGKLVHISGEVCTFRSAGIGSDVKEGVLRQQPKQLLEVPARDYHHREDSVICFVPYSIPPI